jgi:hypothetical protein
MSRNYHCAYCERDFTSDGNDDQPACPTCGQTESVQSLDSLALIKDIRRQWFVVFAVLFLAGAAFALYQWTTGR